MKIVVVGPTWPYRGGIAHYNVWLCNTLIKRGHDLHSFTFKKLFPKILYPGKKQVDKNQSNYCRFNSKTLLKSTNPFSWIRLVRNINSIKPDYVLLYWWTPFFFLMNRFISKFVKSKIICLCHNVLPHKCSFIDKILTRFALKKVDFFIVHGDIEKKTLTKLFRKIDEKRIVVNEHPSYGQQFIDEVITKEQARSKLELDGKILLFFGFIRPYKGLKYLIQAMRIVNEKYKDITLLIVGEFWSDKDKYTKQIKSLNRYDNIQIIDNYIPDNEVKYYFQASDIVVLPYISATGSGIIQIAFAFNKPVIVTKVGTLEEIVKNRSTGFVIPPENPKAIAQAIMDFYENIDKSLMEKEIQDEAYRFSWDKLIDTIEGLT